jgi:hypothetical protein
MTPATNLLASSFVDHAEEPALAEGSVGASPGSFLNLEMAGNFARFIESTLVHQLGPAAEAFIAANHDKIALFFSQDMADLVAKSADKFGSAHS